MSCGLGLGLISRIEFATYLAKIAEFLKLPLQIVTPFFNAAIRVEKNNMTFSETTIYNIQTICGLPVLRTGKKSIKQFLAALSKPSIEKEKRNLHIS